MYINNSVECVLPPSVFKLMLPANKYTFLNPPRLCVTKSEGFCITFFNSERCIDLAVHRTPSQRRTIFLFFLISRWILEEYYILG